MAPLAAGFTFIDMAEYTLYLTKDAKSRVNMWSLTILLTGGRVTDLRSIG